MNTDEEIEEFIGRAIYDPTIIYHIYTAFNWATQLFGALHFLYSYGYIHRDITPANILLSENFAAKIGDFGCTKESKNTCVGTRLGTPRYMSPPSLRDGGNEYMVSHKNDVYSLGLVLWEVIERRIVLSQYGIGSFQYETFIGEIYAKKITEIEEPHCPEELKRIIAGCISFEPSSRQRAYDIFSKLGDITMKYEQGVLPNLSNNLVKSGLQLWIDENQKILVKPIGFDGSNDLIPISSAFDFSHLSVDFNTPDETKDEFTKPILHLKEVLPNLFEYQKGNVARERFMELFKCLSDEEKKRFLQTASDCLFNQLQKMNIYDEIDVKALKSVLQSKPETIDEAFEDVLQNDLFDQLSAYHLVFQSLEFVVKSRFMYWDFYESIFHQDVVLRSIKNTRYCQRMSLKCYFSTTTKEEWLFLEVDSERNMAKFVRKDFTNLREFPGFWVNENSRRFPSFVLKTQSDSLFSQNELLFSHLEPIDFHLFFAVFEKLRKIIEKCTQANASKFIPIDNCMKKTYLDHEIQRQKVPFQLPGYVFQLRNPPTTPCHCEVKCELKQVYGKVSTFGFDVPNEMRTMSNYDCTNYSLDAYQMAWVGMSELLNRIFVSKQINQEQFGKTKFFAYPKRIELKKDVAFHNMCFIFLLYLNDQKKEYVLLDYPWNYDRNEKIPCFDFDWNFHSLEASVLREHFEELEPSLRKFFVMDSEFNSSRLEVMKEIKK
ncbi:unnamed protein product, partial [Mesorhabditis belari]|uniref:Protein kinase domain-containing protein n=1 Tax=Mesorhabditis belari TaxID=2138241 RepID=A0AAF3FIT6_9BILA